MADRCSLNPRRLSERAAVVSMLAMALVPGTLWAQARVNSRVSLGTDQIAGKASGAQGNEHAGTGFRVAEGRC